MLYSNHETLKFLNSQKRLNARYSKWVEFLQDYIFVLKYKAGVENKVVDALSRRVMILVEVIGFERLREEYESCLTLKKYMSLRDNYVREMDGFLLQDGYLFWFCKLCIPVRPSETFSFGKCMQEV